MPLNSEYARNVSAILQNLGDAQARGAEQKGKIWSGFLGSLGQTIAEQPERQADLATKQQQRQIGAFELQEKQQAFQDAQTAKQIFAKYGGDLEKARPEIMAISPSLGISLGKSIDEGKKLQLELATSKLAHDKAVLGFVGQQLNGVTDEPSYLRAVTSLHAADIPTDDWPDDYDQGFVEQHQQVAMTVKEKLDQEDKRIDDARQLERVQREEAAQRETARHNEATEAISQNDKLTDNQRQAARDVEITRHDKAMEARPVGGGAAADVDPKAIAEAIKRGEQPPTMQGLYRYGGAVRSELAKDGYNLANAQSDWTATQKHLATLNGSQQTRLRQAVETAAHSLDVIDDLSTQWDGGKFPALNKVQLSAAKNGVLGPKAQAIATQLEAQISDVTSELGNVYMGGNSPTDHALQLAGKNLSADWTRSQLKAAIDLARKNLQIRQNSIATVGVGGASATNPYSQPPPGAASPPASMLTPTGRFNPATGKVER